MKHLRSILCLAILALSLCTSTRARAQVVGVKTNLLYDATATFNLGVEVGLAPRLTLDISGNFNPWTWKNNMKWKHWMVQPELRLWTCQRFAGHFFALHGLAGQFNFGGIRTSLPEGDLLLDDFVSMFPFNNYLTYVAVKGSDLQEIFNFIASSQPFVIGGAKLAVTNHQIDTLLVGGKPIDPKKTYGVASIDFLIDGGDGMTVGKNAKEMIVTDKKVIDEVLTAIYELQAAGKPLEYSKDGRCTYDKWEVE